MACLLSGCGDANTCADPGSAKTHHPCVVCGSWPPRGPDNRSSTAAEQDPACGLARTSRVVRTEPRDTRTDGTSAQLVYTDNPRARYRSSSWPFASTGMPSAHDTS